MLATTAERTLMRPTVDHRIVAPAILLLLVASPTPPLSGAGRAALPTTEELVPVIRITRHVTPQERARREREEERRREQVGRALRPWCASYRRAIGPVRAPLNEALASLAITWSSTSHNLGYPIRLAVEAVPDLLALPAPDPLLDRRLRSALRALREGADAVAHGCPTVAQMRLYEGRRWLALADESLRGYGLEPFETRPVPRDTP